MQRSLSAQLYQHNLNGTYNIFLDPSKKLPPRNSGKRMVKEPNPNHDKFDMTSYQRFICLKKNI